MQGNNSLKTFQWNSPIDCRLSRGDRRRISVFLADGAGISAYMVLLGGYRWLRIKLNPPGSVLRKSTNPQRIEIETMISVDGFMTLKFSGMVILRISQLAISMVGIAVPSTYMA